MDKYSIYLKAKKIRLIEEKLLELFSQGKIFGTTHTSIGQELIPVTIFKYIKDNDYIFSNHRCHGHYLAYGGDIYPFIAEVMGKKTGLCGGRGGSQHIHYKRFFSNGIQGGIVGNATGIALGLKHKNEDDLVVVFLGDGTFGEGLVYESFNFAATNNLKILYVLENNHYAMSTEEKNSFAGTFEKKGDAFGLKTFSSNTYNEEDLENTTIEVFNYLNREKKPVLFVIDTYRLSPHSKGDDTRTEDELSYWRKRDFIYKFELNLQKKEILDYELLINEELNKIVEKIDKDDNADHHLEKKFTKEFKNSESFVFENQIVLENINKALYNVIDKYNALIVGEDIKDIYGGAFKVTKNLSNAFPKNLINTTISEAGIVSWVTGAALVGVFSIAEIMFGDFLTLAADQIVNHASKYHWLYNGAVTAKMIIRTPMGGGRGYGATHSQSLEKLFIGIPGLKVLASNIIIDHSVIFQRIYENEFNPILFIENKKMYGQKMLICENNKIGEFFYKVTSDIYPSILLSHDETFNFDILLVTYSETTSKAINVSNLLMYEDEINIGIILLSQISPIEFSSGLIKFLKTSQRIIFVEESTEDGNFGDLFVSKFLRLKINETAHITNISSKYSNIPIDRGYEEYILVSEKDIIKKIKEMI